MFSNCCCDGDFNDVGRLQEELNNGRGTDDSNFSPNIAGVPATEVQVPPP